MGSFRFQSLFGSAVLVALLAGCAGPGSSTEPGPDLVIESNTTLGDEVAHSLIVRRGAELTVTGSRVEVQGDLLIEQGASIRGTQERLILIIRGDLTQDGAISSAGDLVMVSDPALIKTAEELNAPRDSSEIAVVDGSASTPRSLANWTINGNIATGVAGTAAVGSALISSPPAVDPQQVAQQAVRSGQLSVVGNLTFGPAIINIADGAQGGNTAQCGARGGNGKEGGNLEIEVFSGTLRINSTTFSGGNGGNGGNSVAGPCANGTTNTGGNGGRPGRFRLSVEQLGFAGGFEMQGFVNFTGWSGGHGGDATITGLNGAAPGAAGANVNAIGGVGNTVERSLFADPRIRLLPGAAVNLGVLNGGDGGKATATGGNGMVGLCDPLTLVGGPSGNGGVGTSAGGKGGDVRVVFSIHPAFGLNGSLIGGDGGNATGGGGTGPNGVHCQRQGGRGGNGGDAISTPGERGSSGGAFGTNGTRGTGIAAGGTAGNGGNAAAPPPPAITQGGAGGVGGSAFGAAGFTVARIGQPGGAGGNGAPAGNGGNGGNGGAPGAPGGAGGAPNGAAGAAGGP